MMDWLVATLLIWLIALTSILVFVVAWIFAIYERMKVLSDWFDSKMGIDDGEGLE